jgi:hypothetical protein
MRRTGFWIGAGFGFSLLFSSGGVAGENLVKPEVGLTISVFNNADVSGNTLRQAEEEAERIFRRAGITVKWLNCDATRPPQESGECREARVPAHLHLRIVPKALRMKEGVLGVSFLAADGTGCQADLFYERMEKLHNSGHGNLASLLAHVAAHEIGHLLLGTNSHAPTGIMRGHWTDQEVEGIHFRGLSFSAAESVRMQKRLSTAMEAEKRTPGLLGLRAGDSRDVVFLVAPRTHTIESPSTPLPARRNGQGVFDSFGEAAVAGFGSAVVKDPQ